MHDMQSPQAGHQTDHHPMQDLPQAERRARLMIRCIRCGKEAMNANLFCFTCWSIAYAEAMGVTSTEVSGQAIITEEPWVSSRPHHIICTNDNCHWCR